MLAWGEIGCRMVWYEVGCELWCVVVFYSAMYYPGNRSTRESYVRVVTTRHECVDVFVYFGANTYVYIRMCEQCRQSVDCP